MSGYVVRGKEFDGDGDRWLVYEPTGEHMVTNRRAGRTEFKALSSAIQAWCDAQVMCSGARIFRVEDDGTETPLPTYEEALAKVAALEAEIIDTHTANRATVADLAKRNEVQRAEIERLREKARMLGEEADGCEDARSLFDAIKAFCKDVEAMR